MMFENIEKAVEVAFSQDARTNSDFRRQAQVYCDAIENSPDGWMYCCKEFVEKCKLDIQLLASSSGPIEITSLQTNLGFQFWCLQVLLSRYQTLSVENRASVRQIFDIYITELLPSRAAIVSAALLNASTAIVNKVALLFVRGLSLDYPNVWPTALHDLLWSWERARVEYYNVIDCSNEAEKGGLLNGGRDDRKEGKLAVARIRYLAVSEFVLTVLEALDTEVVCDEMSRSQAEKNRNMEIKDSLREGDIMSISYFWQNSLLDFGVRICPSLEKLQLAKQLSSSGELSSFDSSTCPNNIPTVTSALSSPSPSSDPLAARFVKYCSRCLTTVGNYSSWVDIQVVANAGFLEIAFEMMSPDTHCASAVMEMIGSFLTKRMDGVQRIMMCHRLSLLSQIFTKAPSLFTSSASTNLPSVADPIDIDPANESRLGLKDDQFGLRVGVEGPEDEETFTTKYAELLNVVGLQLLEAFLDTRRDSQHSSPLESNSPSSVVPCSSPGNPSPTLSSEQDVRVLGGVKAAGLNPYFTRVTSNEMAYEIQVEGWSMIQKLLPHVCTAFSHPNISIAESVEPFISELSKQLKHFTSNDPPQSCFPLTLPVALVRPLLRTLFQAVFKKIRYPVWYDFNDEEGEPQEAFTDFRKTVSYLFKRMYPVDELTSFDFLTTICTQRLHEALATNPGETFETTVIKAHVVEAILHLFLAAGEHYRDIAKELKLPNHALVTCLQSIFSSDALLHHPHPHVRILVFSMIYRCMAFIRMTDLHPANENYVEKVLSVLLGDGGVAGANQKCFRVGNGSREGAFSMGLNSRGIVLGHASVTLLRFVRNNSTSVAKYTSQILQSLSQCEMLSVQYYPSSTWKARPSSMLTSNFSDAFSGPLDRVWTFDDQNRCFETVGCLLGGNLSTTVPPLADRLLWMGEILAPLVQIFNISPSPSSVNQNEGGRAATLMSVCTSDITGCVHWVSRVILAIGNMSKGFTQYSPAFVEEWLKCLKCVTVSLQMFGVDSRIRSSVILLTRRLLTVLREPWMALELHQIIVYLFDSTFYAFSCVCKCSSNLSDILYSSSLFEHFSRADSFPPSTLSTSSTLPFVNGHSDHPLSSLPKLPFFPPSYNGYQEISQLVALLCQIIVTLKDEVGPKFFLLEVPSILPSSHLSSASPSPSNTLLFIRLFRQLLIFYNMMSVEAGELLRERNEIHRDIHQLLHSIASQSPSLLLTIIGQSTDAQPSRNGTPKLTTVNEWLIDGTNQEAINSLIGSTLCIQTWTLVVTYIYSSFSTTSSTSLWSPSSGSGERESEEELLHKIEMLFERLKVLTVVNGITKLMFLLDLEDSQHTKTLLEICNFLRVFSCSSTPSCLKLHPTIVKSLLERFHSVFLVAIPAMVCSPQDAKLLLQAVAEAPNAKTAKDILRKWIITQQMSARGGD